MDSSLRRFPADFLSVHSDTNFTLHQFVFLPEDRHLLLDLLDAIDLDPDPNIEI